MKGSLAVANNKWVKYVIILLYVEELIFSSCKWSSHWELRVEICLHATTCIVQRLVSTSEIVANGCNCCLHWSSCWNKNGRLKGSEQAFTVNWLIMLCYLGQQYHDYFIPLCRVPNLAIRRQDAVVYVFTVTPTLSYLTPELFLKVSHLCVLLLTLLLRIWLYKRNYLSLLIFQLLTHYSWKERGMHSWRRTRASFSGNICQLYSFSWLENCTVSKETCFCHWQRHASPLGRPEYLPC